MNIIMNEMNQVDIGSNVQDLAGSMDISWVISETLVGSNSVSGGTSLGMMTGGAAAAVDARILATLLTKHLAKSWALSLSVADRAGGCNMLSTVFHSTRELYRHVESQLDEDLASDIFM